MKSGFIRRIRIIVALFALVALLFVGKLYMLQIARGEEFAERADRQYVRPAAGIFDRGSILLTDRYGREVSGATLSSGFTLALNPKLVTDPKRTFLALSSHVALDRADFDAKVGKTNDPYEELAHRISPEAAEAISALSLPGVILERERWRFYPGGSLAAHTLGFVAYDGDLLRGRYGLERYYDDVLSRTDGSLYSNFFAEIFRSVRATLGSAEESKGDIITTIEPSVQLALMRTLDSVVEEWHPVRAGGIVMDPKTGEIVALAISPSFDLNEFGKVADVSLFGNPLIEDVYEPGSIMKPLTMAAGIDSGAITAETTYNDRGFIEVDGATIRNFDGKGRGVVPMQDVLNDSLNTGASFIVERMGIERFSAYFKKLELGEETGIDLPGEVGGLIANLDSPRKVEHFTASFGQGIAMTPIATVRALATLASDGVLVTPHIVRAVRLGNGITRELAHDEGTRVFSKETAREVSRMLTQVVDEALADGGIKREHYSVAAKTGTAQIANPGDGGYYDDRYLHTFFGYFPSYDARFIIFLFAYEPQGVKYASQTLTAPFDEMTSFLINYYDIPGDR